MVGSTEKRNIDRVRKYSELLGDENVHEGDDSVMERSAKSIVYIRRGDGDKQSHSKEDGKDNKLGKGRGGSRFEGSVIRKRDVKDGRPAGNEDSWKLSRNGGDRDDSSGRESGGGPGSGKRTERSWKEIAKREEGRNKILKVNHEKERDANDKRYRERMDKFDRGKGKLLNDKGAKVGETRLPTKLKVKVGGIVRTLRSDSSASKVTQDFVSPDFDGKKFETRPGKVPEPVKKRRQRLILQDNSDDDDFDPRPTPIKKDVDPVPTPIVQSVDAGKGIDEDTSTRGSGPRFTTASRSRTVRKSSRIPKKKILEDFEDDVPDEGMRDGGRDGESCADGRSDKGPEDDGDMDYDKDAGLSDKDASVSDDGSDDLDDELDNPKDKRGRQQDMPRTLDTYPGKGKNAPLTARQRTMQLGKDGDADVGPSLIEFPSGLTHSTRRGRAKLTEEERQVKKTEAATRRKQLVENAAKEIQATAIQKILGQDSSRKRKEERLQKQREEIEQGKKAAALEPASNSVRWTMGPDGTTVSWSQDVELPKIFSTGPSRYPPAREKCAAPMCSNAFKYRDSKSSLPLCSLKCYRVIQPAPALIST